MKDIFDYPYDSKTLRRKRLSIRGELLGQENLLDVKIAILGGSTTHDIRDMLELFLLKHGIRPAFYESEYGLYWQDVMFDNPALDAFDPDVVFIHTTCRNIPAFPDAASTREDADALLEEVYGHFEAMWGRLAERRRPVIQNNFEYPFFRLLGNRDAADHRGRVNFITRLNLRMYDYAATHEGFYINDINWQAADYGLERWADPFYWHMYKYALCLDAIPTLAANVANIVKSLYGRNKKALALDLDNTLWGGVVGDDGVDGIEIGQETAMGQVYAEFQGYLKALKKQGVLLNVVSKNDEENALAGLNHPAGVLKPEDFVSIRANWDPKDVNLRQMAGELALTPDSFVFVDDNPAERALVGASLDCAVPELDRPERYIVQLDRAGYFEVTGFSADDLRRSEMYRDNARRASRMKGFESYEDYLRSLDMRSEIRPFEPVYYPRITQLTNKSNQFNLTTKRCSQEEIAAMAESGAYITLYGRLMDCFGDNGVVSLVAGRVDGERLDVELWLMSCRVLKRDVEAAMLDALVARCRERGVREIYGHYYPTPKNGMVRDFYGRMGFERVSEDAAGSTCWRLETDGYQNKNRVIAVDDSERRNGGNQA